jgi:tRNA pseudouridine38-40 synthase
MRTLSVTVAYDGTNYVGWQRQARGVSIQGLLEAALGAIEGEPVPVAGAGRTDAGVHAEGQIASFTLRHPIAPDVLVRALNARLPPDVRVRDAMPRPEGFHARFSAVGKTYRYALVDGPMVDPFDGRWVWHVPQPLDVGAMAETLAPLLGTHDFAAFQSAGSDVATSVRSLRRATCARVGPGPGADWRPLALRHATRIVVEVEADGFLRHMVRAIVGTLVEAGRGRRSVEDVARVLASRDRARAGPTAPARGLCLVSVDYPGEYQGRPGPG